jgi:hypothetical protein
MYKLMEDYDHIRHSQDHNQQQNRWGSQIQCNGEVYPSYMHQVYIVEQI